MVSQRQRLARKCFREANPNLFPPKPAPPADGTKKKSKKNKKSMFNKAKKAGGAGRSKHPLRVPGMRPGERCFICKATEHVAKACPEKALWDKNKVVGEHRLNRAYADPSVQLADRLDPDAGKRKRARGPDELETQGPVLAVPLRAVGAGGSGAPAEEVSGPLAKRLAPAPGTAREMGSPSASSVAESLAVDARAGVAARSFGVASFAPEEVSGGTPSHVYGRGTKDTRVEERPPLPEPAAVVAEGGHEDAPASGDGVSAGLSGAEERAGGSEAVESLGAGGSPGASEPEWDELVAGSSRAAPVTANVGALCALDFKISDGVASVCEEVGGFAAPPYLNVLFNRVPVDRMFRTIEANAMKALMVSRALERDVQSGYAEIQGRIDAEAARSAELAAERSALRAKVKKLKAKVAELEGRRCVTWWTISSLWTP